MNKQRLALMEMIYNFGLMFNQQPSSEKIEVYADTLLPVGEDMVRLAFERIIKSGSKFFPSIPEIYEALNPKRPDESAIVANEIIKLIRTYGPHAEKEMIAKATPLAKSVLIQLGSTDSIRKSEHEEIVRAQLERLARAISEKTDYQDRINEKAITFTAHGMKRLV